MASVVSAVRDTVSISMFNKGYAGKIFTEVKHTGPKVVIKNNVPEVVIMPTDEYVRLMDELNDYRLLTAATERMSHFDPSALLTADEVNSHLGISEAELEGFDEVELE